MSDYWDLYPNPSGSNESFLKINDTAVADNDKIVVGMYSKGTDFNFATFDFHSHETGMLETTGTISNTIYFFIKSTDNLTAVDDIESWVDSNLGGLMFDETISASDLDDFKNYYSPDYTNQLDSLDDYTNFIWGCKLSIFETSGTIRPDTLRLSGGSTSVEVTYTTESEFTVSPSSPITVGSEGVSLIVSLIDGYQWDDVSQLITIDGNSITGIVSDGKCTFALSSSNVGSGGVITWGLHYSVIVPPVEDRIDFFTIYEPTNANMTTINNAIFISSSGTADLSDYFISYKKFFCNIPIDGYKQLKAGKYDFGETAPYIKSHTMTVDCGSVEISERFQSLLDYDPFSRLTLYLPFIGFEELEVVKVMGRTLRVEYVIDIVSGRCLAKLYVDSISPEICFAEYAGTIASNEIFGFDSGNKYSGTHELMDTLQLGELGLYIIVSSKIPLEDNIADYEGIPSNEIMKVGDAVGFIKYTAIHVDGLIATDAEKSEIESLLKSGIIV